MFATINRTTTEPFSKTDYSEKLNVDQPSGHFWFQTQYRLDRELDQIVVSRDWKRLGSWMAYNAKQIKNRYFEEKIFNVLKKSGKTITNPKQVIYILDQCFELYERCSAQQDFAYLYQSRNPYERDRYLYWAKSFWRNGVKLDDLKLNEGEKRTFLNHIKCEPDVLIFHIKALYLEKKYADVITEVSKYFKMLENLKAPLINKIRFYYVKAHFRAKQFSKLSGEVRDKQWRLKFNVNPNLQLSIQYRINLRRGFFRKAEKNIKFLIENGYYENGNRLALTLGNRMLIRENYSKAMLIYSKIDSSFLTNRQTEELKWNQLKVFRRLGNRDEMRQVFAWAENRRFTSKEVAAKFCYWGRKLANDYSNSDRSCYQKYPRTYYGLHIKMRNKKKPILGFVHGQKFQSTEMTEEEILFFQILQTTYSEGRIALGDSFAVSYFNAKLRLPYFKKVGELLVRYQRYHLLQRLIETTF